MWATWNQRAAQDEKLVETTRSLLEDTLQRLIYGSAAVLFIWFFVTGQASAELLLWKFWVAMAVAIGLVRLCTWLVTRRLIVASVIWLVGLFVINTLFVFLLQRPEAIFFYSLLPLQAVIVLGWQASVAAAGAVALVLVGLVWFHSGSYPPAYLLIVLATSVISAFLGWVSSSSLLNEVRNSLFFSRLAQKNLEEAREHRGQMVKVLKDLDLAYYRLERANAALVAAWKEAETAEKFKAEFVTYVSHEMRTPLNLILGFSEAILTAPESYGNLVLPGPYRADVNKIYQNASHLIALVEDVIDLSRANVNRIPITREPVDVKGLVNDVAGMVRDYIQTKGLALRVQVDEHLETLVIDRLRIRQVLLNLLVNAARFTSSGWIQIGAHNENGRALFKVTDTGQGIDPLLIDQIFEDYHTSGRTDPTWHSGSGLGLPISKKLVELHGGEMGVVSEPLQGATFWFALPLEADVKAERPSAQPVAFNALPYRPASDERILVLAHADPGVGRMLQRLTRGLRVNQAADWEEAVEQVRETHALALLAAPAQGDPLPLLPLPDGALRIEFPLPGASQLAGQLGVVEVLEKPVLQNVLLEAIARANPTARNILIVDDDAELTEMFQRLLSTRCALGGCRVANGGADALEMIASQPPDLIILDLLMPEVDGNQVIRELRARPATAAIPIIVISGTVGDAYEKRVDAPLLFSRAGGFKIDEAIQVIEAAVSALSPGWE